MATAAVDACSICANSFNSDFYRSVSLPCGHDFCLLCLVRLEASGKRRCPTCRRDWAGFEVPALPDTVALAETLRAEQVDEGDIAKKKGLFERCEKHSKLFEYWAKDIKEFYCTRCAAENRHVGIELIEDVIPQIKAALEGVFPNVEQKVHNDLKSMDERHEDLVRNRNCVKIFLKAVQTLDDNFKREIEEIASNRSKSLGTTVGLTKLKNKLIGLKTVADINLAVECISILKKVAAPSSVPTSDLPKTLLCNIIHSYVDEAVDANPPSKSLIVNAVQKYGTPSPETVRAAEQLKGGQRWTVDSTNCEAALLALADRQPSVLRLIVRDDARKALPLAALAKAAQGCDIGGTFVDTFYSATGTATDPERLEHIITNKSLRLLRFYGHLDHPALDKLPHTITELALAIGSAADAAAVSSLRPWKGLEWFHVSVSSRVTAKDLKPLPKVPEKGFFSPSFPTIAWTA